MTNLMVLACLPAGSTELDTVTTDLATRLVRYDWTRHVAPYRRDFEMSLTQFAKQCTAISRDDDADLDSMDLDNRLKAWRFLAEHHNADFVDEDERLYIDDEARPYTMTTANPDGQFDQWWIGGMWTGRFRAAFGARKRDLIRPEPYGRGPRWRCVGGTKQALDLIGMRRAGRTAAELAYDRWHTTVSRTEPAAPWQEYADRHHADPDGYPLSSAAAEFLDQPRLRALIAHDRDAGSAPRFGSPLFSYAGVVDEFQTGRVAYVDYRANWAVLGYALLTLDGQWLAPGVVGRWASSTDTIADRLRYTAHATTHLDTLDPACRLVGITCHG